MDEEADTEDQPSFRAKPVWNSKDEKAENVQQEITWEVEPEDESKNLVTVGRSKKRDLRVNLKAVSADHCRIQFYPTKGWTMNEKGKDGPKGKCSSNGSFLFLKTHQQMEDHVPSELIPIQNDMIITFVNYNVRVKFENKTATEYEKL